jgi:hypothetical protein
MTAGFGMGRELRQVRTIGSDWLGFHTGWRGVIGSASRIYAERQIDAPMKMQIKDRNYHSGIMLSHLLKSLRALSHGMIGWWKEQTVGLSQSCHPFSVANKSKYFSATV